MLLTIDKEDSREKIQTTFLELAQSIEKKRRKRKEKILRETSRKIHFKQGKTPMEIQKKCVMNGTNLVLDINILIYYSNKQIKKY